MALHRNGSGRATVHILLSMASGAERLLKTDDCRIDQLTIATLLASAVSSVPYARNRRQRKHDNDIDGKCRRKKNDPSHVNPLYIMP